MMKVLAAVVAAGLVMASAAMGQDAKAKRFTLVVEGAL
jgi:hypothetical protein